MVNFWVEAIIEGRRRFSQTPAQLKEAVRAELIARGREDLIDE